MNTFRQRCSLWIEPTYVYSGIVCTTNVAVDTVAYHQGFICCNAEQIECHHEYFRLWL